MPSYFAIAASTSDHTYLPPWSMQNNAELAYFLRSITLRTMPHNFKAQTYTYIVFKCVLLLVGLLLVAKLLFTGRWWVVRVVRVPRGYLICPNACEALVVAACTFYFVDLFYRGFSLEWHYDPNSNQHGMPALYAIRLFFLWLAGFIHNAASFLVFPLNPLRVRPLYWHLFLFGVPLLFLIAYVPPVVLTDRAYRLGNALAVPLIQRLDANPEAPISPEDARTATLVNEHVYVAWAHLRQYAIVGTVFLLLITFSTLVTGVAITRRTWQRYNAVKRSLLHDDENQRLREQESGARNVTSGKMTDAVMTMDDLGSRSHEGSHITAPPAACVKHGRARTTSSATESTITDSDRPASQQGDRRSPLIWRKLTLRRRVLYLVGIAPLTNIDVADKGRRPTANSVVAVLRDFLRFCIMQFTCLLLVELTMLACAILVVASILQDLRSDARIPVYGTPFVRTSYVYFVLEIWVIVAVGSPLIILMLWRQIYPIHIDFSADVYTRKSTMRFLGKSVSRSRSDPQTAQTENIVKPKASTLGSNPASARTEQMPWTPSTRYTALNDARRSVTVGQDHGEEDDSHEKLHRRQSSGRMQQRLSRIIGSRDKDGGAHEIDSSVPLSLHEPEATQGSKARNGSRNTGGDDHKMPFRVRGGGGGRGSVVVGHRQRVTEDMAARDACGFLGSDVGVRSIVLEALDSANGYSGTGVLRNPTLKRWERQHEQLQQARPPSPASPPRPASFSRMRISSAGSFRRPSLPTTSQDEPRFATPHGVIKHDPMLASP